MITSHVGSIAAARAKYASDAASSLSKYCTTAIRLFHDASSEPPPLQRRLSAELALRVLDMDLGVMLMLGGLRLALGELAEGLAADALLRSRSAMICSAKRYSWFSVAFQAMFRKCYAPGP